MKILPIICVIFTGLVLAACTGNQNANKDVHPRSDTPGWETYASIRNTLEASGEDIDYDTLMQIYNAMVQTRFEIPHMDRLLLSLIAKRNPNPRIDQMILIFSARALGASKFPVPNAYGVFKTILTKDDRLNGWVISFVAEAIADYRVDIPQGDILVDLLEAKLTMIRSASGPPKEYYGFHFLPPPKGDYIRSYIAGIEFQPMRVSERNHYYSLIYGGYSEADIETALRRLLSSGITGTGGQPVSPMRYLSQNRRRIF